MAAVLIMDRACLTSNPACSFTWGHTVVHLSGLSWLSYNMEATPRELLVEATWGTAMRDSCVSKKVTVNGRPVSK